MAAASPPMIGPSASITDSRLGEGFALGSECTGHQHGPRLRERPSRRSLNELGPNGKDAMVIASPSHGRIGRPPQPHCGRAQNMPSADGTRPSSKSGGSISRFSPSTASV
jgi:hypothetical protein